ncbi:MAG: glycosyltransferase family 4 protein [Candidatus Portnoybacteria bacterium]|nr:glycosyltransferase family 4 protein [Candidatus Portnoybacteria bacterium]
MNVLTFGWEFPPYNSGGLGVACQSLTKALMNQGLKIIFVLPKKMDYQSSCCRFVFADSSLKIKTVNSLLQPYMTSVSYQNLVKKDKFPNIYRAGLFGEVDRYGYEAKKIARAENFDIIHAHDWLSFPAGLAAKKVSGKPLVVHIHATEFDRTGGDNLNRRVYEIEKEGCAQADAVIAVSDFTKNKITQHYGINPNKVKVVHNAINYDEFRVPDKGRLPLKAEGKKIVLFVGRITIQKGPDYFLRAAKRVLDRRSDVFFIMAGAGDMEAQLIQEAAFLDISDKFLFAGFLRGDDLVRVYQAADLYVLSSVSEPFGLTPLESLAYGTPVLISKQSGVSEILNHALKVDFWDIDEMANKIISVLEHQELGQSLKENGEEEIKKISWRDSAQKCVEIYNQILTNSI